MIVLRIFEIKRRVISQERLKIFRKNKNSLTEKNLQKIYQSIGQLEEKKVDIQFESNK